MTEGFTVGMALYDQPPYFYESARAKLTAMHFQITHPLVKEIVIVDNNPHPRNKAVRQLPEKTRGLVKYVEMPRPVGTAAPRNRVFEEATQPFVACVDPHVFGYNGFFEALTTAYNYPGVGRDDLLHGPMMTEARGVLMATHLNRQWREEMLGTWGVAWRKGEVTFSVLTRDDKMLEYVTMPERGEQRTMTADEIQFLGLPHPIYWSQHEAKLTQAGCWMSVVDPDPFPIPGHGMGFFACRKEAWLPFHSKCRGFGGEEITTGIRYRQAGRRCWCVSRAMWWHDFHRVDDACPYPLTVWDKARNVLLEYQRLGLPVEEVHDHFFKGTTRSEAEWQAMLAGAEWPPSGAGSGHLPGREFVPVGVTPGLDPARLPSTNGHVKEEPVRPKCGKAGPPTTGIDGMYHAALRTAKQINADLPHLRHLAATCGPDDGPGEVIEITDQAAGTIAFLAGRPKRLASFGVASRSGILAKNCPAETEYLPIPAPPVEGPLPPCDLLFLDVDPHTSANYHRLLEQYAGGVARYIALHDTVAYGEYWNDSPGLLPAVRQFLADHPDWAQVAHHTSQNGLMVLSRRADDALKAGAPPEAFAEAQEWLADTVRAEAAKPKGHGPGTELNLMLHAMGIDPPSSGCDCKAKMQMMDEWSVKGCKANLHTIVGWLKDGAPRWKWDQKIAAGWKAVTKGLLRSLWGDPYRRLVEEAIRRAEEKGPPPGERMAPQGGSGTAPPKGGQS